MLSRSTQPVKGDADEPVTCTPRLLSVRLPLVWYAADLSSDRGAENANSAPCATTVAHAGGTHDSTTPAAASGAFPGDDAHFLSKTQPEEATILFDAECWFADRFQKVRFDQTVKQPLLRYEEKPEIQTSLSTWIRTPEMSIHTEGNRTSVRIYEPDAHPGGYYSPFDVRVLGLVKTAELMQTQTRKRREHFSFPISLNG